MAKLSGILLEDKVNNSYNKGAGKRQNITDFGKNMAFMWELHLSMTTLTWSGPCKRWLASPGELRRAYASLYIMPPFPTRIQRCIPQETLRMCFHALASLWQPPSLRTEVKVICPSLDLEWNARFYYNKDEHQHQQNITYKVKSWLTILSKLHLFSDDILCTFEIIYINKSIQKE